MPARPHSWSAVLTLLVILSPSATYAATVSSPDGRIVVNIEVKDRLEPYPPGPRLYYSVAFDRRPALVDSSLALDFKDAGAFGRNVRIGAEQRRSIDSTWQTVVGKSRDVHDRANELTLSIVENDPPRRHLGLVFRAYDDGVAFRWELPVQPGLGAFRLSAERSEFRFAGNHTAWAANYGSYATSQEDEFQRVELNQIRTGAVIGLPMLVKVHDAGWVALTEANLDDWAGMYLTGSASPNTLVTTLSPRPDEPDVVVKSAAPRRSPWRVIMVGRSAVSLIESNIVLNLSEPCALADTSWIKAGRSAWDRWWAGDFAPDAGFTLGINNDTVKYYTRFAAEMGWEYVIIDWQWYGDPLAKDADVTKPVAGLDIPALVAYARERNVRVLIWARWNSLDQQMEAAFSLYERWGLAGVKIDFMDRNDQEMVNFYMRAVKSAAAHHLTVDFHGAYEPTGLRRTYPNLLTREGVLGNEYNKWSTSVTPVHKVTIPFTRMLAGPMDFTPGGFRQRTKATFKPQDVAPFVMGTRANELAELVVYESELAVLCDSPYNYRGSPAGLEFYKVVPATWDETRGINGEPGEYVTVARRSGRRWFIGSMNGDTARTFQMPLSFLPAGRYTLHAFADRPDSTDYPDRVDTIVQSLESTASLTIGMAAGGGYAAWIEPEP